MKNIKLKKIAFFFMLLTIPFSAMADDIDDANGNGDVQDVPAAPIDDYIPFALIASICLGYSLKHKSQLD